MAGCLSAAGGAAEWLLAVLSPANLKPGSGCPGPCRPSKRQRGWSNQQRNKRIDNRARSPGTGTVRLYTILCALKKWVIYYACFRFNGVLGCDYFSAYRRYLREFDVSLQFCLAHLIRDVKFLTTLPDARDRMYGTRLREALRELFGVIHRRELLTAERFQAQLEAARAKVLRCGTHNVPATNHCRNLAKRFEEHGENYFRFITTPGVEPTNNLAEQAIRFVVIDRLITQGTRSEKGNRWCERIWTVIATCTQQGRSVFEYWSFAFFPSARRTGSQIALLAIETPGATRGHRGKWIMS